jgi:hypothetical protein
MPMHLILEGHLSGCQARRLMVEDEVVSLLPDSPSTNHKNLHEKGLSKRHLSNIKFLRHVRILIPNDSSSKPPSHSTGAVKKRDAQLSLQ